MNEKDLFRGMSNIDDDLIQEAELPMKKKSINRYRLPAAIAAGFVLVASLSGTMFSHILRPMPGADTGTVSETRVEEQDMVENASGDDAVKYVGVAAAESMGEWYRRAENYEEVYELAKAYGIDYSSGLVDKAGTFELYEAETTAAAAGDVAVAADADGGNGDYSVTNVMTEGVDESDIVKTDGSFIYMVRSGSILISDIRGGGVPKDEFSLTIPLQAPSDVIREMYVDGKYLTVITEHAEKKEMDDEAEGRAHVSWIGYSYDMEVWVYVYDISDPMHPAEAGIMHQSGSYHTSRKVDDIVYLFTREQLTVPAQSKSEAVTDDALKSWIPTVNDLPIAADCIYMDSKGYQMMAISGFSVEDPAAIIDAKVVVQNGSDVYVGSQAIYFYSLEYTASQTITEVTRMAYKDGMLTPGGSTTLLGCIQDSFAINEKDGYLRVLTTDWSQSTEVNTLFVLDADMKLTGRIDEIARGESIYAARFLGDMVYFITYHNSDPLFAADLSDPAEPKLLGQVQISGFSDYLHIWDEDHILGIGYETDEDSNRQGIKLVMFDVTDPLNPKIENTMVIAENSLWCYSGSVSSEYKGVLADPGKNLIGFGYMYDIEESDSLEEYWKYSVFSYNKKDGFTQRMMSDLTLEDMEGYRGLYAGDWFYLAGNNEIRTFDMQADFAEITK